MADTVTDHPLARVPNGADGPLWFDRQVVEAADLTLGQDSAGAALARARRFLHGWGVAMGLVPAVAEDVLKVGPGYGVTPSGREVFLPVAVSVAGIARRVTGCCGLPGPGCALVPEATGAATGQPPPRGEAEPGGTRAWLVARPVAILSAPRAGIAEGCAHPGNALRFSRRCGAVEIDLLCAYPASHAPAWRHATAGVSDGLPLPGDLMLEMPGPVPEAEDVVILGRVTVDATGTARYSTADRRALWPTMVLQDWLIAGTGPGVYLVNRNPQATGEHELHRLGCPARMPDEANRLYLGVFADPAAALAAARTAMSPVDACAYCLPALHRG